MGSVMTLLQPKEMMLRCVKLCCVCVLVLCIAPTQSAPANTYRYFGRRWGSPSPPPPPPPPTPPPVPTPAPTFATLLVGGTTDTWTTGTVYQPVQAQVGETVVFKYSTSHNVYSIPTKAGYDACDFSGATELGSTSQGGGTGALPNVYNYQCSSPGQAYIACEVGAHCAAGQKVTINCDVANSASAGTITWALTALCAFAALLHTHN